MRQPEIASRKESEVDVIVQEESGDRYIIEMQVAKVEGFEKRAQIYASRYIYQISMQAHITKM